MEWLPALAGKVPDWVLILVVLLVIFKGGDVVIAFVSRLLSRWSTDIEEAQEDNIVVATVKEAMGLLRDDLVDVRRRVQILEKDRDAMVTQSRIHSHWDDKAYAAIVKYEPDFPAPPPIYIISEEVLHGV